MYVLYIKAEPGLSVVGPSVWGLIEYGDYALVAGHMGTDREEVKRAGTKVINGTKQMGTTYIADGI